MSQFLVENFSALSFFLLLFYCFCFSVVAADFLFSFSHFFRVGHWLSCCCWRLCSLAMVFSSNSLPPYHLHSRTHWDSLFSPGLWCFFSLQYWILYVWNLLNHFFTGSFFFFFSVIIDHWTGFFDSFQSLELIERGTLDGLFLYIRTIDLVTVENYLELSRFSCVQTAEK